MQKNIIKVEMVGVSLDPEGLRDLAARWEREYPGSRSVYITINSYEGGFQFVLQLELPSGSVAVMPQLMDLRATEVSDDTITE